MKQSTSFAQVANKQSISLSSALRANTPPTKEQTTSRKFLTLSIFFLLSFFCTTNAWGQTWTRVTTMEQLTSGGTFIMGYEATAKSGTIVPLRSADCDATTSANGYFHTGTTANNSTNSTITMSSVVNTSAYEVYISSPASGKINIQRATSTGNYYGASSGGSSKNTARLYTKGNTTETNLIVEWASETNNQFKLKTGVSGEYKYLKYNTSSPRFAFYNSAGEKIVFYKKSAPSFTITAQSNNTNYGTVSLSDKTITAFPKTGYRVSTTAPYTISPSNSAKVTQNGNTFTVTPSANTTITINFEAKPKYTVTLVPGSGSVSDTELEEESAGAGVTLPEPTLDCDGWTFAGWKTTSAVTTETTTKPTLIPVGTYKPTSNITLYAVYQRTDTTEGTQTVTTTTDKLTRATTGITGTSYSSWSGKEVTSSAVYAGQSAGGNESIQLRSNNSNSGVITTASGGKATKVVVSWNSNTSNGRTLDIYGKNSAYSEATDLYSTSTQGTKLGSIVYGTSTELTITGDYEYIGLRSNSGAMYLTSISIEWATTSGGGTTTTTYYHSTPECTPPCATVTIENATSIGGFSLSINTEAVTSPVENCGPVNLTITIVPYDGYQIQEVSNALSVNIDDHGTATVTYDKNSTIDSKVTLVPRSYDVVLHTNEGTINAGNVTSYEYGVGATLPTNVTKNGYVFGGWYEEETFYGTKVTTISTTETGNKEYWAKWDPAVYSITYNTNGGSAIDETSGTTLPDPLPLTTKIGYTFAGWYTDEGCTQAATAGAQITQNTILYAKWTANTYTVEFNANDGTGSMSNQSFTYGQSQSLTANAFTRTNYAFKNWNTKADGSGTAYTDKQSVSNLTTTNGETVTLYAQWTQLHTITWMVGGSELTTGSQTTSVENGKKITAIPANPNDNTLEDCGATKFMGWSTDNIGSTPDADAPTDLFTTVAEAQSKIGNITENKTFYAVFATEEPSNTTTTSTTTISGANSGTIANVLSWSSSKNDGTTITAWNDNHFRLYPNKSNGNGSSITITPVSGVTISEVVLTATSDTYAKPVKYNIDGGSDVSGTWNSTTMTISDINATTSFKFRNAHIGANNDQVRVTVSVTYSKGGTITTYSNYVTNCCATPVPTNGAYTSVSGTEIKLTWEDAANTNRYHITGGNLSAEGVYEKTNKYYNIIGLTECEEYTFYVSAYPEDGCESEAIAITAQPFSGAKTVTFNYNGNGKANTTSSTSCGNTSITLPTPTWAGYRFMGWFTAANGGTEITGTSYTPTADITLFAHWEKEYNVTYNANGGSTTCAGDAYIAGETVTVCTTNPTKTGYSFAGWTYSPEVTITDGKFTMPASNITIIAQWIINQYTVTWKPNEGNWAGSTADIVHTYDYDAAINRPADPTRDGYRFTGWNAIIAPTMPATNITYTAQWKQNYTITFHDGDDVTPWTQTKDAESINLTEYVGTLACDDYQFAGWSTDATQYNDQTANITTWVTGTYTPTANIHLYAVYVKGDLATDFTLNCDGGVYEIWEKGHNQHMAGRQNGSGNQFYTTEYWDANNSESNGAPFTITKVADNTYTLQNADGQYITRDSYDGNADELEIEETLENADRYKWTISNGTNGTWRFTNNAATSYALVYYNNKYFELRSASSVTAGNTTTYDLELTPAQTNVYQSNPNCGPYTITFETGGGEFIQGNYKYSTQKTSNLTEPTISQFPAAELDGYTFAGWKDGSPQEDINYEPYLKKADDNLVVSSNKTYYAVYYYYDEEEDIDWSKEFTTAIYADVNGIKYFLAGAPNGGTMSSTTDCGYVSEVTITPGTGANAGKYKITVNGVAMAPEANETDLLNGTYWWTITERSVGSGEYKISGQDKKNIVLRNSSWGHYTYNQGSEYGNGYYYPHFGKCLQHHWTSNPTLKPSLNLSGEVYVTATNARGIMATSTLKVYAKQLNANEKVNITSNSKDVYFSADRTVNFVKADKPTNTLTITASPSGVIEQDIYVHYRPSVDGTGIPEDVVVSANLETPKPSITDDHTIHVRNLPADFVIAAKWGDNWYAMPANMNSQSSTEGWLIEVDDPADPTKAIAAPNTTKYGLKSVYTSYGDDDRFENYGERLVFVENVTTPVANKTLYNGGDASSSKTNIQVYAQYANYYKENPNRYEWIPTTTDLTDYTLTSAHQFTKDDATLENARTVSLDNHGNFGTLLQDKSYSGMVRLLPVDNFYGPAELQVVEWKQNSVSVMYTGAGSKATTKVGSNEESNVQLLFDNDDNDKKIDHAVYSLATTDLTAATNQPLVITIKDDAEATIGAIKLTIPAIVATDKRSTALGVTEANAEATSIVVLDGATLTADATKYTYDDVVVYPGGKLVIGNSGKLGMYTLTLRLGSSWGAAEYEYKYPQFVLNNQTDGAYSNSSGQINLDYVTTKDQYYTFVAPFDVKTKDIKYPIDIYGTNVATNNTGSFEFEYYDGAARAAGNTGWKTVEEPEGDGATLNAGQGYTFLGMPKKVSVNGATSTRQKYGIHRIPMKVSASNVQKHENADQTVPLKVTLADKDNNSGWNMVGNPYMSEVTGLTNDDIQVGELVQTDGGKWQWDNPTTGQRFLVIPSNDGRWYTSVQASNATLHAFKHFFVQIHNKDANAMSIPVASRVDRNLAPARYAQAEIEKDIEIAVQMIGDKLNDQMDFLINDIYSTAFEKNADFTKMMNATNFNIYGVHVDNNLSFVALDKAAAMQSVAIGFQVPKAGEYQLSLSDKPYVMADKIEALFVTDHEASPEVTTNLVDEDYTFYVNQAQTNNTRFTVSIILKPEKENTPTGVDNINTKANQPIKFLYQDKIYILRNGMIYDTTGKQVITINK